MSKYFDLLRKAEAQRNNLVDRDFVLQAIQEGKWDRVIQDLQDGAEQLRQTMAALEEDRKAANQKSSDLKRQLQESKSRLQVLSQEMAERDKRFDDVNQALKTLAEQLKTEIQEKGLRVSSLEKEIKGLKAESRQEDRALSKNKVLKGPTKERRSRTAKTLLEELLTRAGPIQSRVTCPQCKRNILVRFRLTFKSGERKPNKRELLTEEVKKPS